MNLVFLLLLGLSIISGMKSEWGFYGHRKINRMAVFTLPPGMFGFYKKNIEYISLHAVDPDKRRYALKDEFSRHYIDIDHWDSWPFDQVPRQLDKACMKYGELYFYSKSDTIKCNLNQELLFQFYKNNIYPYRYNSRVELHKDSVRNYLEETVLDSSSTRVIFENRLVQYGVLPYFLEDFHKRLEWAFLSGDKKAILRISADLGHYLADAHVPLHTTLNYNGQLTNQLGIHAFWESRLPELFSEDHYDFVVGKASYIDIVKDYIWSIVLDSHSLLTKVLEEERKLRLNFPDDMQFCFEERLESVVWTQCKEYSSAYHKALGGMVEKRMQDAVKAIGDFWYTAWVNAGQPELDMVLESTEVSDKTDLLELDKKYRSGSILGREHKG
jgi:hypothetical protein